MMNTKQAEKYLSQYFKLNNFIWLEGAIDEDITDAHIGGIMRFCDKKLLTVSKIKFAQTIIERNVLESDYDILLNAKNNQGESFEIVVFPMTKKNVKGLDYKGNYLNYYVGNEVILSPFIMMPMIR